MTGFRTVLFALGLAGAISVAAQAGWAKDACVEDSIGNFVKFTRVKVPKKPGAAKALAGVLLSPAGVPRAALTGTLVRLHTGELMLGLVVNGYSILEGLNTTGSFVVGADLAGSGFIDEDGDGTQTTPLVWMAVDCSAIPEP